MVRKICCLIYRNHKIKGVQYLLLRKKLNWEGWEFVKGEVGEGEALIDAVIREVKQETGLHTRIIGIEPFTYSYDYLKGLDFIESNVACFLAEAKSNEVFLSEEHSHHKWMDYEDALKMIDFEGPKAFLQMVNQRLSSKIIH